MTSDIVVSQVGDVLTVVFNRVAQHNAMTWEMYQELVSACELADYEDTIHFMVLRGAGGNAFVAGTDISQFVGFTGEDGVAYEQRINTAIGRLASVTVPTISAIDGFCIGGGLAIAAVTDLRIASANAQFGVPIARTLGNCLSLSTMAALVDLIGRGRTTEMLITARLMNAQEAAGAGLVTCVAEDLSAELDETLQRLRGNAPLTMWATKQAMSRVHQTSQQDDSDIISAIYGSDDFANAVNSFIAKTKPVWRGQ